ncbi:copper chaperone PCu(A)C [Arenimonas terrae]|uniref:Copper chaperone PCu(A)C n=1 Tax=Arenimonas terrae TaxID=2546226 RepID=A0A5C4RW61_9GAMM|nr:copper chaperone PCu(A)C [Arenimonas terrae]TNJ35142.1 copper chaperone PCu(A)C [Arenimonas terrae]
MNVLRPCLGLTLWLSASAAVGAAPDCAPVIEKAWVRAAPPGASTLAGYLVLRNPCAAAVEVVDVESRDFGMPMIHRTELVDGVSRMRPAGRMVVAAGASLRFEPGGLHLMLMKPLRPLAEGDSARLRLVLADGRRLYVEVPVRRSAP